MSLTVYYRYTIECPEDCMTTTLRRRLQKASRNQANHIYLDIKIDLELISRDFLLLVKSIISEGFKVSIQIPWQSHKQLEVVCEYLEHIYLLADLNLSETSIKAILHYFSKALPKVSWALKPTHVGEFNQYLKYFNYISLKKIKCYWLFENYNPEAAYHLSVNDIFKFHSSFQQIYNKPLETLPDLEIYNNKIPKNYELESLVEITWQFQTELTTSKELSVIIPTFNNAEFLSNVLFHLMQQTYAKEKYEIIVVDDGSTDESVHIIKKIFQYFQDKVNLKYIYWSKDNQERGPQNFFRAGLARNLGVHFSESPYLLFLDADMLTPESFIEKCIHELKSSDLIQFKRSHVKQKKSFQQPIYSQISPQECYIEDEFYWGQFYNTKDWRLLPDYWKYTCTYALGLKKSDFYASKRFKKYYISYGLEDTDLGYEMHIQNKRFKLIDLELKHLTSYNLQQYKNSSRKRRQLLKVTSALFYIQHTNSSIYNVFRNFYRFEKGLFKT